MKKARGFMNTLPYLCLVGVIVLGLMTIVGTGGGGGGGGGDNTDTTPPTVLSTSPADGATDVAVNTSISATFNEEMDGSSINTSTFTLKDSNNDPVSGTVTYAGMTATFASSTNLDYFTTYTAIITTGVKDLAGNSMSIDDTWSFTAESTVNPPTDVKVSAGDGLVTISWNTVTDANYYYIYRASVTGVTKSNYSTLPDGLKTSLIFNNYHTDESLANGTTYYYVVTAAADTLGESEESMEVSATPQSGATAPLTKDATNVTDISATMNGGLENPEGCTTTVWLEYGPTPSYEFATSPEIYASIGTITVSADLTDLQDCTTYYFRIVTENSNGTFYGAEKTFSTYITPQILASELNGPFDIHLDAASIYWVEVYSNAVKKVPINGGTTTIVASSTMWGGRGYLAIDATHIYWTDVSTIWKRELSGGTVTTLASGLDDILFLRVHSRGLYFRSDNGIEKVDLDTGTVTTLVPGNFRGGLAVDSTGIYTASADGETIVKTALDGGPVTILAAGLSGCLGLLLDSGFLYWGEGEAISKMSITGGTITTIASDIISPYYIAKDDTHLYWTDGVTVNKVDLNSGAVVTLAVAQRRAYSLVVDATSVYWICRGDMYYPPLGSVKKAPKSGCY